MYCTKCGSNMKSGERFCTTCGEKLDMDLNTKRIRPNVKYVYRASAKVQQSYGLGDLGKDGIPGSKLAMFGLVITLVTAFMGSLGCFTSLIGIGILIAAYLKGFKSTWVWVGIALGVCLLCRSFAILSAELDCANQRAWDDMMGIVGIFF